MLGTDVVRRWLTKTYNLTRQPNYPFLVAPPLDPRSFTQLLWALGWWLRPLPQYTSLASQLASPPTVTCDCSRSTKGRERNNRVQYAWLTGRLNASGQISISVYIKLFKIHKYIEYHLSLPCHLPLRLDERG